MRQQSFHPVCQKCYPRVYMNSLGDVGITRDISWRETFFEPWRRNFDLFLKTAFYVSKGKFWVKNTFFESFVFFQTLQNFERTFTVLGEKVFGKGYQNWRMQFSSHKVNQKIKLLENLFYSILQNFERTFTVLGEKLFSRVIKIKNCSLRLKRSIKKPNFWKFSFFLKLFATLNEHLLCLARKFSAGIPKLKNAVFVS